MGHIMANDCWLSDVVHIQQNDLILCKFLATYRVIRVKKLIS